MNQKQHKTAPLRDLDYWLAEWLKSDHRASEHTAIAYRADINQFIASLSKPFDQIDHLAIMEHYSAIEGARTTRARKLAAIRSFYRFLNARNITAVNLDRIEGPKIIRQVNHENALSEKEVLALLKAAKPDAVMHLFIRFLYLTGVRKSEVLALRWRDLSELGEEGEAHIQGKGRRRRSILLPCELWNDLQASRGEAEEKAHIFPTLTAMSSWRAIKRLAKAAQIDKTINVHSFRHAHASHSLANGSTIAEVAEQLGHGDFNTTCLYLHPDKARATARRLRVK